MSLEDQSALGLSNEDFSSERVIEIPALLKLEEVEEGLNQNKNSCS
jgi:hypothetical protein